MRDLLVVQKISLIEIISTAVLLAIVVVVVVESSRVFHDIDSATLQPFHRCTPAPYGILAVPAVLPTLSFGDVDPEWIQIFGLYVRCRLVLQLIALLLHCFQGCVSSTPSNKDCPLT